MKKYFYISIMIIFLIGSNSAFASDDVSLLDIPLKPTANIEAYAEMVKKFHNSVDESLQDGERPPAPPYTYMEVYAAISTNHPTYEYFTQSQLASAQDHGGAELYIVTVELGYGTQIAKFNSASLTELQNQAIVDSGGTVIGWYRWWNASGNESGQFTYQGTSSNSPWNTMSDWINIR